MNDVVAKYYAEIYQYVGDEMVISWGQKQGFDESNLIRFYYSCQQRFADNSEVYAEKYGLLPEFKAGAHFGRVTMVEIGDIKRDIAYHGDTLNVASRIENLCTELNKTLLISEEIMNNLSDMEDFKIESMGVKKLKGRSHSLEIFSVELNNRDLTQSD